MAGALRAACDRKSRWNNPLSQEVRSLSSQRLLQLCGSGRPHSWTDLHVFTLTTKAPDFVLKVIRVIYEFKISFDSSPLPDLPLLWAPPKGKLLRAAFLWANHLLVPLQAQGERVGKTLKRSLKDSFKRKSIILKVCQVLLVFTLLHFLLVKM